MEMLTTPLGFLSMATNYINHQFSEVQNKNIKHGLVSFYFDTSGNTREKKIYYLLCQFAVFRVFLPAYNCAWWKSINFGDETWVAGLKRVKCVNNAFQPQNSILKQFEEDVRARQTLLFISPGKKLLRRVELQNTFRYNHTRCSK